MIDKKITSVQNKNVKKWLEISNNNLLNEKIKTMIVEGFNLINECYQAGLLTDIITSKNLEETKYHNINFYIVTPEILKKLSSTKSSPSAIGIINLEKYWEIQKFDVQSNILLLEDIQDPGNLGTLLRSAYAFNFKNIILVGQTVNFLNPKVIRATQGMFLKLHFQIIKEKYVDYLKTKIDSKYKFIGTSLSQPGNILQTMVFSSNNKYLLMLGNEGHGLTSNLEQLIQENVKIKISENLDSLNVAQAGSIIMYEINKGDQ